MEDKNNERVCGMRTYAIVPRVGGSLVKSCIDPVPITLEPSLRVGTSVNWPSFRAEFKFGTCQASWLSKYSIAMGNQQTSASVPEQENNPFLVTPETLTIL